MKYFILVYIFFTFCCFQAISREAGQTEITTEDGIEVFKKEKYYLLKKNINIVSDEFKLKADDTVKAFFNEGLYDIKQIISEGNVILSSNKGMEATGEKVNFSIKDEYIIINGINSLLVTNQITMKSDESIKVNNLTGLFTIKGKNSNLIGENINITGYLIDGKFINIENANEVENLYVEDDSLVNIKTDTLDMYALKAIYDKKNNIIELFDKVKVIREQESIVGDYARINTLDESYKVTSEKSNKKVRVLLKEKEEEDE